MLQKLHLKELLKKKTAEATAGLMGNEMVGKITSAGKSKSKEKKKMKQLKDEKFTSHQKKDSKL